MKRVLTTTLFACMALALLVAFPNCDDGDDKTTEDLKTSEDVTQTQNDVTVAEDTDEPIGTVAFTATVVGFGEGDPPLPKEGVTVQALDNDTNELIGNPVVSDGDGVVNLEFTGRKLVGFRMTMDGYKDTYQYDLEADAKDEQLWAVSIITYNMALGLAGLKVEPGMSTLAGAVYYVNAGEEEVVGCATVTSEPVTEDIRYMSTGQGLPTSLEEQPSTSLTRGQFIATNIPPQAEKASVTAWMGEAELGTARMFTTADSICLANVYVDKALFDKNPTPEPPTDGCK